MVTCPTCHAEAEDEARFCSQCGTSLDTSGRGHLSDFEIGKIAALDSVKKDILKWVGGSATVIGAAFAALAYLGLNATLQSSVTEQVKSSLQQNHKDINKAIRDMYVALGKTDTDQASVKVTLEAMKDDEKVISQNIKTSTKQLEDLTAELQAEQAFITALKGQQEDVRHFIQSHGQQLVRTFSDTQIKKLRHYIHAFKTNGQSGQQALGK